MVLDNYFWRQLKFYRSTMSPVQRKRTRARKPKGITYPFLQERKYGKYISAFNSGFILFALELVKPYLMRYAVKMDARDDELEAILTRLESNIESYYGYGFFATNNLGEFVTSLAEEIFGKHSTLFQEEVRVFTGGNPISLDYTWWNEARSMWEQENFRLIKSMNRDFVTRLNTLITSGISTGMDYDKLLGEIEKLSRKYTGFNARRLARDQIGKLNGMISKYQQTSLGMQTYYWHTMGDEKVRGNPSGIYSKAIPQHYYLDSMLCSWDNPGVYSDDLGKTWKQRPASWVQTHPGFSIMCFPSDTKVKAFEPTEMLYRRRYFGRMVTLKTSSGTTIRCTYNHPILRADGVMVPAHFLNKGDSILKVIDKEPLSGKSNIDDSIPTFEEAFDLCSIMFGMNSANTTTTDFHNDGSIHKKVNTIPLYGELPLNIISKIDKSIIHDILSKADMCLSNIPASHGFLKVMFALGFSSTSYISLFSKLFTLFFTKFPHSDEVRLRTSSELYTIFSQSLCDDGSGDTIFFGERQDATPTEIFSDNLFYRKLLSIVCWLTFSEGGRKYPIFSEYSPNSGFRSFNHLTYLHNTLLLRPKTENVLSKHVSFEYSHVYNLQSPCDMYMVSDNRIIVKNCRCLGYPSWNYYLSEVDKSIEGGTT